MQCRVGCIVLHRAANTEPSNSYHAFSRSDGDDSTCFVGNAMIRRIEIRSALLQQCRLRRNEVTRYFVRTGINYCRNGSDPSPAMSGRYFITKAQHTQHVTRLPFELNHAIKCV